MKKFNVFFIKLDRLFRIKNEKFVNYFRRIIYERDLL